MNKNQPWFLLFTHPNQIGSAGTSNHEITCQQNWNTRSQESVTKEWCSWYCWWKESCTTWNVSINSKMTGSTPPPFLSNKNSHASKRASRATSLKCSRSLLSRPQPWWSGKQAVRRHRSDVQKMTSCEKLAEIKFWRGLCINDPKILTPF